MADPLRDHTIERIREALASIEANGWRTIDPADGGALDVVYDDDGKPVAMSLDDDPFFLVHRAEFIAEAPGFVAALLGEVERLREIRGAVLAGLGEAAGGAMRFGSGGAGVLAEWVRDVLDPGEAASRRMEDEAVRDFWEDVLPAPLRFFGSCPECRGLNGVRPAERGLTEAVCADCGAQMVFERDELIRQGEVSRG